MSWKIRHEGSPRSVEGLTGNDVIQGLLDGRWDPTDEVLGPTDTHWQALEVHPQFADLAGEIEPPPPKVEEDESRLDMNALIDVCLVLLVFFILTTSYAALQKMLDMPDMSSDKLGVPKISPKQIEDIMIKIDVAMENGAPVFRIEGEKVERASLTSMLSYYQKSKKKSRVLLDCKPDVPHGAQIAVQDAAKGAGISEVSILVPKEELLQKP